jgi:hypothetical protein
LESFSARDPHTVWVPRSCPDLKSRPEPAWIQQCAEYLEISVLNACYKVRKQRAMRDSSAEAYESGMRRSEYETTLRTEVDRSAILWPRRKHSEGRQELELRDRS